MLALTQAAKSLIARISAHTDTPDTAGLRIAVADGGDGHHDGLHDGLCVSAAGGPQPGDTLAQDDDARVFLGPVAQVRVSGRELDVRIDDRGRAEFVTRLPSA